MSLLRGTLSMGRRQAESRMTETVLVGLFRDGTDPLTGDPTRTLVTARYEGKGRIRYGSGQVSNQVGPGQDVAMQEPTLSIPSGSPATFEGDEVLVTASTSDGALVGRVYRVQGQAQAGQVTALRVPLKEFS